MKSLCKSRIFSFYLPQFHPIKENDAWWGKGFTEWTNVGKAKKYFKNHYQPRIPADLGYYDLRIPEIKYLQAELARKNGIEGFIYWHYWFGNGKRILERPFSEVFKDRLFTFPFALAWANESWKGYSHGIKDGRVLIKQLYPSIQDYINHFNLLLPIFEDSRYIKVNGKPLFLIYKPNDIPNIEVFIDIWNALAKNNGFSGIYFIAHHTSKNEYNGESYVESLKRIKQQGFNAINFMRLKGFIENRNNYVISNFFSLIRKYRKKPFIYPYKKAYPFFSNPIDSHPMVIPSIISGWDNTPRNQKGIVLDKYTPDLFDKHVKKVIDIVHNKPKENRIIILKSWNEWAEGNYVEPDLRWGHAFLQVIKNNNLIF